MSKHNARLGSINTGELSNALKTYRLLHPDFISSDHAKHVKIHHLKPGDKQIGYGCIISAEGQFILALVNGIHQLGNETH